MTRPNPRSWDGAPIPAATVTSTQTLARSARRIAVNDPGATVTLWDTAQRESVAGLAGELAVGAFRGADELARRAVGAELAPRETRALAGAAKDLAIMGAVLVDKAQLLAGAPTARVERVNADELMRRLGRVLNVESRTVPTSSAQ